MDTKKQSQKPAKTLPVTQLPIVTLTEKDMSSVNGGTQRIWAG
jgi:bacteriocin-like protein